MIPSGRKSLKSDSNRSYSDWLGLADRMNRLPARPDPDPVPVLDLLTIALLFGLMFTRFVMVPGVSVDLPDSTIQVQPARMPVVVLTIGHDGNLFFEGNIYNFNSIQSAFDRYFEGREATGKVTLLLKAPGSMELPGFLELSRIAQSAGFVRIQIIGKYPTSAGEPTLPPDGDTEPSSSFRAF